MRSVQQTETEDSMVTRAAWLHYAGRLTQAAVAKKLGITSVKAHRLIAKANQAGAVKVTIEGEIADCVALENALSDRYGLGVCEVAPDLFEAGLPLRALGIAGADFLRRELARASSALIGLGHGQTLASVVRQLPKMSAGETRFVSLLGGLSRTFAAHPYDVMHRIADKTGAPAYFMPVPFFANTVEDREVMLAQRGVRDVVAMAERSDLKIVGIGTASPEASLVSTGMISEDEIADVKSKGGVGEVQGHFFDAAGREIETALAARTLAVRPRRLERSRIVAVAGGDAKVRAIRSILLSGLLSGLITDERTARTLTGEIVERWKDVD